MAIEVHESHLLVPPSAVPTLFQRFTQHKKTLQGSIFLNNLICHEWGVFSFFPQLSTSLATSVFLFLFPEGIFATWRFFI
jgi:hypothetical protein